MVSKSIILLNHSKRKRIRKLAHKTRNKIVFRRCQILLHLAQQRHPNDIAATLGCDVSTVYRTRKAFLRQGERTLVPKKSPGRPRKLTPQQVRRLDEALAHEPRALGKNFSHWTAKKLCRHLHFSVHAVTLLR